MSALQDGGVGRGFQAAGQTAQEGLGTVARILDLVLAAKGGNLGGALQRQYQMTQDPDIRASLANSPFGAGFTGIYGGQRQGSDPAELARAGLAPGAGGVSVLGPGQDPANMPWSYQANLPPLGEGAQTDLAHKRAQAMLYGSQVPFNLAQADYFQQLVNRMRGGGAGGMPGMVTTGVTYGPSGATITDKAPGFIEPVRAPAGSRIEGVDPARPRVITAVRPGAGLAQLETAIARAQKAIPVMGEMISPVSPGGPIPVDLLPSGDPKRAGKAQAFFNANMLAPLTETPIAGAFTPGGSIGIPGTKARSIRSIGASGTGPEAKAATILMTSLGEAANVAKALGDAGILAVQDVEKVERYLLPTQKSTREEAINRAQLMIRRMTQMVNIFEQKKQAGQLPADDAGIESFKKELGASVLSGIEGDGTASPSAVPPPEEFNAAMERMKNNAYGRTIQPPGR